VEVKFLQQPEPLTRSRDGCVTQLRHPRLRVSAASRREPGGGIKLHPDVG